MARTAAKVKRISRPPKKDRFWIYEADYLSNPSAINDVNEKHTVYVIGETGETRMIVSPDIAELID